MNTEESLNIASKQNIEIAFWKTAIDESPESQSVLNLINKMSDAKAFVEGLDRHKLTANHGGKTLELGAGQGWASCVYKRLYPSANVTVTDISEFAIASVPKWETVLGVGVDDAYACQCYKTREDDSSIDLVFCFAAAHHFLAHRRTLREIARVLKPSGVAIYFYEPVTPKYVYRFAYWRINRKRSAVPEDVLIPSVLKRLAKDASLKLVIDYHPSIFKRGKVETIYYLFLIYIPFLRWLLPCTANLVFTKL